MKSMIKLIGISSCCLVIGMAAARAEPVALGEGELDRVTAGDSRPTQLGFGFLGLSFPWFFNPRPGPVPGGPVPFEGPGCNTGGGPCEPSLPSPSFPFGPGIAFPPPFPTVGPFGFGDDCGAACDRGVSMVARW